MKEIEKGAGDELVEDLLWRFGEAEFDERAGMLKLSGTEIELEPRPLEVLAYLLRHAGEVVTKEELLEAVWHRKPELISDKVLTNAIGKLRRELKDEQEAIITTLPRRGYRFSVPVSRVVLGRRAVPKLDFKPGERVPRREQWRLISALDVSQRSEVWLAEHEKTHARRVFKFSADGARLSALKREVTLSRVLVESLGERADFVPVLEWNFEEAPYFIECDYGGDNWLQWAESQGGLDRVPLATRLAVFTQAAEAIGAAHGVGVLHKDIKPANLLIAAKPDGGWQVRVTDFGSGRLMEPGRLDELGITRLGFTQTQAVSSDSLTGTPLYLAPELLSGQSPTQSSDIYALGVLLHQLVVADFRKPLSSGWELEVQDELLREDIALAAAGDARLRLDSARALAQRVAQLPQRRLARSAALREAEEVEVARLSLARARQRRPWAIAVGLALLTGLTVSLVLLDQVTAARDEARKQAEISRTINSFLNNELIAKANPLIAGRSDISVIEAAKAARESIAKRFQNEPSLAAELHTTLGSVFTQLAQYELAISEFQLAEALATRGEGDFSRSLSACYRLAQAQARHSQLEAAELTAKRCDKGFSAFREPSPTLRFLRARTLGDLAMFKFESDTAISHYSAAIEVIPSLDGLETTEEYGLRQNLGSAYAIGGKVGEAENVLRPLAADLAATFGSAHARTLDAQAALAQTLLLQDRDEEAADLYARLLGPLQAVFGRDHSTTLQAQGEMAVVYSRVGRIDESLTLLNDAVARLRKSTGRDHLLTLMTEASVAGALMLKGDLGGAEALQTKTRAAVAKQVGVDHPVTQAMSFQLAHIQLLQSKTAEARMSLAGTQADIIKQVDPSSDWVARIELLRGCIELHEGDRTARQRIESALKNLNTKSADSRALGDLAKRTLLEI